MAPARHSRTVRLRAMRPYRRFMTLPRGERWLLVQAAVVVVAVRVALWLLPAAQLMTRTTRLQRRGDRSVRSPLCTPGRIAWAVGVVSRRVPHATCLTQALATQTLLLRSGFESQLRIGVALDEDKHFDAHAWVEVDGEVVIGDRKLERYARLPDLTTAREVRSPSSAPVIIQRSSVAERR